MFARLPAPKSCDCETSPRPGLMKYGNLDLQKIMKTVQNDLAPMKTPPALPAPSSPIEVIPRSSPNTSNMMITKYPLVQTFTVPVNPNPSLYAGVPTDGNMVALRDSNVRLDQSTGLDYWSSESTKVWSRPITFWF